jgi:hypothetical protein
MGFEAEIYLKDMNIPFYKTWAISELLTWTSFFLLFLLIISISFLNEKVASFVIDVLLFLSLFPLLTIVFASFKRIVEYEKINGKLEGKISFNETSIFINDKAYYFNDIKDFKIGYGNKYGDFTGNTKIGATYSQGLNNSVSFYHNSNYIEVFFQLKTENQLNTLKQDLYFFIINEDLPLNTRTFQYVDKKFKNKEEFKNLIHKHIKSNKLSCTEGLLMIGYSSDKEAKELRQKYCS